jgi:hypothetical protein
MVHLDLNEPIAGRLLPIHLFPMPAPQDELSPSSITQAPWNTMKDAASAKIVGVVTIPPDNMD